MKEQICLSVYGWDGVCASVSDGGGVGQRQPVESTRRGTEAQTVGPASATGARERRDSEEEG